MPSSMTHSDQGDCWFDLTYRLPGRFFINNQHERVIFQNRTMEDYFHRDNLSEANSTLGANVFEIAARFNPNHLKLANKHAQIVRDNNQAAIKERRVLSFEQAFPIDGALAYTITLKGPIFDCHGYMIAHFIYNFSEFTNKETLITSIKHIHQKAERSLLNLNLMAHKPGEQNKLLNLIRIIEAIETSI